MGELVCRPNILFYFIFINVVTITKLIKDKNEGKWVTYLLNYKLTP